MNLTKYLLSCAMASSLVACNGNDPFDRTANPFPEEMSQDTPEIPAAAAEQVIKVKTFDITAEGEMDATRILHFVAGEKSEYQIQARSFVDQTEYSLKGVQLPAGATLKLAPGSNSQWILSWTPPVDFIPAGQQGRDVDVAIEFIVGEGSSARAKNAHAPFEKQTAFRLTVRHSDEQPVITSSADLDARQSVKESDGKVKFTVVVTDPKSNGSNPPVLYKKYDPAQGSETTLPGDFAVAAAGAPKHLGSGKWEIPFEFNAKLAGLYYRSVGENKSRINVSFGLQAQSAVTSNLSPEWSKTLTVELTQENQ